MEGFRDSDSLRQNLSKLEMTSPHSNGLNYLYSPQVHDIMMPLRESDLKTRGQQTPQFQADQSGRTDHSVARTALSLPIQRNVQDQMLAYKMHSLKQENEIAFLKESLKLMVPRESFEAAQAMMVRNIQIAETLQKRLDEQAADAKSRELHVASLQRELERLQLDNERLATELAAAREAPPAEAPSSHLDAAVRRGRVGPGQSENFRCSNRVSLAQAVPSSSAARHGGHGPLAILTLSST